MNNIISSICRGAIHLDINRPKWHNAIDLTRLSADNGVCEQIYGGKTCLKLIWDTRWLKRHGFLLPDENISLYVRTWMDHVVCRRLFSFYIYHCGEYRRVSFHRNGQWIDLGIVCDDFELSELMTKTKEFVTEQVWNSHVKF